MVVQLKSYINSVQVISAIPVYGYDYRSSNGILRFILKSKVSVIYYSEIVDTMSTTSRGRYGSPYHPVVCNMRVMFKLISLRSVN